MASESSKEPVLASLPGTLQALIHEELRRVAKIVSRSTMKKLAGVRAIFLYTAYIVTVRYIEGSGLTAGGLYRNSSILEFAQEIP